MRRFSTNLAFVDLLFNLLVGFTSLFVLAFLLINPIAKSGVIDPPVLMILEMLWDNDSTLDMDFYVRGPTGKIIYYGNKEGNYMNLERDDLGGHNDTYELNGETIKIRRNYETISFSQMPVGEYALTVHYYSTTGKEPMEITVVGTTTQPYSKFLNRTVMAKPRQEVTVATFLVDDKGKVYDIRTDIKILLRSSSGAPGRQTP